MTHLADELRARPGEWAFILNGGPVPNPLTPNMPSKEVLALARAVWEAQGPWAPLGAFDVAIRNNDLYATFLETSAVHDKPFVYKHGECFECGRPAVYLSSVLVTKVCESCAVALIASEPSGESQLMRFVD